MNQSLDRMSPEVKVFRHCCTQALKPYALNFVLEICVGTIAGTFNLVSPDKSPVCTVQCVKAFFGFELRGVKPNEENSTDFSFPLHSKILPTGRTDRSENRNINVEFSTCPILVFLTPQSKSNILLLY